MGKDTTRSLLIAFCTLFTGILTFLLTASLLLLQPGSRTTALAAQTGSALCASTLGYPRENSSFEPLPVSHQENNSALIGGKGSGLTNILMIGCDSREENGVSRSDCMILCTFDHAKKQIIMTSVLRDLYVPIPGHDANRINAAYALGGTKLLKQTLRDNFGLYVDGCVEVDFSHFSEIIDLLGGVTLELRQDEAAQINRSVPGELTEGCHLLTGDQALAYTRIRNLDADGDFSRTGRQRKVIESLMKGYRETDPITAVSIAAKVIPMLSTDMEYADVIRTILEVLPILSRNTVRSQRIPADGMYAFETIRGMSVVIADAACLRRYLLETLTGEN